MRNILFKQNINKNFILIQIKERPFKCEVCGNGFVALHVLKVHMRQHTGSVHIIINYV